jgi:hypothetical protein
VSETFQHRAEMVWFFVFNNFYSKILLFFNMQMSILLDTVTCCNNRNISMVTCATRVTMGTFCLCFHSYTWLFAVTQWEQIAYDFWGN